jgi:hypothetical protein
VIGRRSLPVKRQDARARNTTLRCSNRGRSRARSRSVGAGGDACVCVSAMKDEDTPVRVRLCGSTARAFCAMLLSVFETRKRGHHGFTAQNP